MTMLVEVEITKRFTGDHYDLEERKISLDSIRVAELKEDGMIGNNVCFNIEVAGTGKGAIRIVPASNANNFLLVYRRLIELSKKIFSSDETIGN